MAMVPSTMAYLAAGKRRQAQDSSRNTDRALCTKFGQYLAAGTEPTPEQQVCGIKGAETDQRTTRRLQTPCLPLGISGGVL
eukprot:6086718-Amphidinium_carterae.2